MIGTRFRTFGAAGGSAHSLVLDAENQATDSASIQLSTRGFGQRAGRAGTRGSGTREPLDIRASTPHTGSMTSDDINYWKERARKAERAMDEFTDAVERHELCGDRCIADDILDAIRPTHRWNCDVLNGYGRWCSCG